MRTFGRRTGIAFLMFAVVTVSAFGRKKADLPPEMAGPRGKAKGPKALQIALTNPWKPAQRTLAIPAEDTPQSITLQIPGRPIPKGKILVMRFRTRMVSKRFGGWNNFLLMHVNGTRLEYFTKDGTPRILNRRARSIKTSHPNYPNEPYFKRIAGNPPALLTVFGHTWDEIEPRFLTDRAELYWFILDISDVARPEGANALKFTNTALAKYFKKTKEQMKDYPLLIDSLEVGLLDVAVRDRLGENLAAGMAQFKPVFTVQRAGVTLAASAGGALRVTYKGDDYYCRSSFSEPGKTIRHNRLWWAPTHDWKVTAGPAGPVSIRIVGRTKSYALQRLATLDGQFIRIRDTITNTHSGDVGIMLNHDLIAAKPAISWRLSGLANNPVHTRTAPNPTVHFSGRNTGFGAAVRDTVMRGQMTSAGGRRKLTFTNDHFGLARDASYTFEWSLYIGGPDFWEFINAVRRDWDANHTIPGMFSFWSPEREPHKSLMANPARLRAYLKRKPIDVFAVTPWFEYYYKPRYWKPRSVYKQSVRETMAKIKGVQPDAKCIADIETFLYYAPESFFKGTLPKYWTDAKGNIPRGPKRPHRYSLSEAGTKVVDATPWRDSVFRDPNGRVQIDLHYAGRYKDGGVNLLVYPTLDNYWYEKFLDMLDFLINDCGLDGVYIDSFTYYYSKTHDRWDGHSVDIAHATGQISKKYARLGLLTAAARRQWVKYVTDRGKIVYTNGKPSSAETQDLPHISFMEAEWTFDPFAETLTAPRAAQAQLSAPLALGIRPHRYKPHYKTKYAEIVQRAVMAYLRHGVLYCHYTTEIPEPGKPGGGDYGILRHMYPFTPVELHEGWLVGKERILTCVSGAYTWNHPEKPVCLRFDIRGMPVEGGFDLKKVGAGWQVKVSLKDWNETAVIKHPHQP